jgi:predicted amidohydrolase
MERPVKVALIQWEIRTEWQANLATARALLERAAEAGAELAILPEMFTLPYDMALVPQRAESVPDGPTCAELSRWAKTLGLVLVGGSIPERDEAGRFYNTSTLWDRDGRFLDKHRKVHLFDVNLPGGVSFQESAVFTAGQKVTFQDVLGFRLGLAICYDLRFPELFRLMALAGVEMVALPGAFNQVSGPAHWELLLRNRAVENTFYVAGVSTTAPAGSKYNSWGHSMMVGPFAEITVSMGRSEGFAIGVLDPERIRDIRMRLPLLTQRRTELYRLAPTE